MRQLFGCLLVIAGCVGFAYLMCLELSDRIRFLKEICRIYEELQYYIAYQRTPVSEAMKAMARKQEPILGEALCEVAEGMEKGKEEEKKSTAINLLALNMDIPFIEKVTGLSQVEILKLKEH